MMREVYLETCHVDILDKNHNTLKYFKSKFVIIIKDFIFLNFLLQLTQRLSGIFKHDIGPRKAKVFHKIVYVLNNLLLEIP